MTFPQIFIQGGPKNRTIFECW